MQQWTIKISSPLFSILSLAAILVGSWDHRTHFWKGALGIFWLKITFKSSPLNRWTKLSQTWQGWFLGGSLSNLCPTAPLLLKIEISSNGQNCSILSQNLPKFELYKHNDELFNMYSEEKIFFKFHPPFFLICIIGQNRQKFKVHKKSCNTC
jgi:hypothetical protein